LKTGFCREFLANSMIPLQGEGGGVYQFSIRAQTLRNHLSQPSQLYFREAEREMAFSYDET
jgi:hypothetical protein